RTPRASCSRAFRVTLPRHPLSMTCWGDELPRSRWRCICDRRARRRPRRRTPSSSTTAGRSSNSTPRAGSRSFTSACSRPCGRPSWRPERRQPREVSTVLTPPVPRRRLMLTAHPTVAAKGRIMAKDKALTAKNSVGTWLKHPIGGPLIRQLLAQAGVDEKVLAPVKLLPLQSLVAMSQGQMPQSLVDDLVEKANSGDPSVIEGLDAAAPAEVEVAEADAPADDFEPEPWEEAITPGRFAGKTVIVTGAASGIGLA